MKQNMSAVDRIIRFVLVIAIIILLYAEVVKGTIATVIGIIGIGLVVSSVLGWSPGYMIFKVSTKKKTVPKA